MIESYSPLSVSSFQKETLYLSKTSFNWPLVTGNFNTDNRKLLQLVDSIMQDILYDRFVYRSCIFAIVAKARDNV